MTSVPTVSSIVNRNDFRATACVDWIDVALTLSRISQHRHVTSALFNITGEPVFADPLDADWSAGGNATVFAIRFHDRLANDLPALTAVLDKLRDIYGFTAEPTIYRLEVACDFYWKGSQATQEAGLLAWTHRLQSSLYVTSAVRPRQWIPNESGIVRPDGKSGAYRFLDNAHERYRLDPNHNFRIGNKGDNLSWHAYFKWTDNNQAPIQDRTQWRARVEVTIQGDALHQFGLNNLSDLDGYYFQRLTPLFRFRRPMETFLQARQNHLVRRIADPDRKARAAYFTMHGIELCRRVHDATPARGMHSFDAIGITDIRGRPCGESRHIEADPDLTRSVKGALRWLTLGASCQKKGRSTGDCL